MSQRVTDLIEASRKLTPEEREQLLVRLQHDVGEGEPLVAPAKTQTEWRDIATGRAAEVDRGQVQLVPWEDVLAELRKC